ncbi:MAG: hypothetical protein IMY82_05065 [Chloroflexi bacterium]|nr:hypothetical protein [Chloroflexota bacterium]
MFEMLLLGSIVLIILSQFLPEIEQTERTRPTPQIRNRKKPDKERLWNTERDVHSYTMIKKQPHRFHSGGADNNPGKAQTIQ